MAYMWFGVSKVRVAVVGVAVAVGLCFGAQLAHGVDTKTYGLLNLFGDTYDRVKRSYVEAVPDEKLVRAALNGLLAALDPESTFLTPSDYKALQEHRGHVYDSLGLVITMQDGEARVIAPLDNTPAARAGLQPGDLIVDISGTPVFGMTLTETIQSLQGAPGSTVDLILVRPGVDPFLVTLTRETVAEPKLTYRLVGGEGYVRIPMFTDTTPAELAAAIDKMRGQAGVNFEGVVLDLRDTPGGPLDAALKVADAFIETGKMVETRGRGDADVKAYTATAGDILKGLPVVVVVDGGTASVAEVVTAALQDRNRGIVVGSKTFGKGSVQTLVPMGDAGYVQLTTATYFTPAGKSINEGVLPGTLVEQARLVLPQSQFPRRTEATLKGALDIPAGGPGGGTAPVERTDPNDYQLTRAFDLLHALSVVHQGRTN